MSGTAIASCLFFLLSTELATLAVGLEEVDLVHDVLASALNGISRIASPTAKAFFVCNAEGAFEGFGASAAKATVPLDPTMLADACRGLTVIMEGLITRRTVKAMWTAGKSRADVDKFISKYVGCNVTARTECIKLAIKEFLSGAAAEAIFDLLEHDYFRCEPRIKGAFFGKDAKKLCGTQDTIANVVKTLMPNGLS